MPGPRIWYNRWMRVLIVRHGEAIDPYGVDTDGHRWLTERGRRTVRTVANFLDGEGVRFDRVFVSPLVRAVQTAEILTGPVGFDGPLHVWAALAGGTTAQALAALDEVEDPDATVALVGHEPLARSMAAHLTGVANYPGFRTGAVCVATRGQGSAGRFDWAVDPSIPRRIDQVDGIPR